MTNVNIYIFNLVLNFLSLNFKLDLKYLWKKVTILLIN